MTIVVGTAGHIDHGKTTLLRALTGTDPDRLPEERRRGMTIDLGFAHVDLDDGRTIDLVDVPGHDGLVGNMLVGAGEIDAVLLVVAADDGPRAQTIEHLGLLDALGIARGLVVLTKTDLVDHERLAAVAADVHRLLAPTVLRDLPIVPASGVTGPGLADVRRALAALAGAKPTATVAARPATLAVDRVFSVKGRGVVVTGTLRGGPLASGDRLRVVPDGQTDIRVREIQVHGRTVEALVGGGRTALNVVGAGAARLRRGSVLTADPTLVPTSRILAVFRSAAPDRTRGRVHAGTAATDGAIGRSGRDSLTTPDGAPAGILRLAEPIALRPGDRFVLRRGPGLVPVGGVVVDVAPPRGLSRRRQSGERVAALAAAIDGGEAVLRERARIDLHGVLVDGRSVRLAPDVVSSTSDAILAAAEGAALSLGTARAIAARAVRGAAAVRRDDALTAGQAQVDDLVRQGVLVRTGDELGRPGCGHAPTPPDPALEAALTRLETALDVLAPPPLAEAARRCGCPPAAVQTLERAARIVVLEPDLAYGAATYRTLTARALAMAAVEPLTPAAFRDATGTSRKYVMAILEDLDRRAILRRTPVGHVPGPRAPGAGRRASEPGEA